MVLTSLTIPESVTNLGSYAFYGCNELNSVVLPKLTVINDYAFYNCKSLAEITLPTTLTKIGGYAFYGCLSLDELSIPSTVTSIGNNTFDGCSGIAKLVLPENLQTIGDSAFRNVPIKTIVVPDSVTSIGLGAFYGCPLESITLPFVGKTGKTDQTSESVFGYVFGKYGSSASSKPEGTTYQGWRYGYYLTPGTSGYNYAYSSNYCADYYYIPTTLKTVVITDATIIPYGAFQNCDFIENITVPPTVTKISNFAFKNCKGITNINLGTALASIGTYAFADCSALEMITIPNTVENIGSYAFNNCSSLSRMNSSTDGNIVLPTGITTVPSYAFAGCASILSVQLQKNLAIIQNNAFENCVGINELTLPNGLQTIGDSAFRNVPIKTIVVPDSVTSIGLGAFYGCPLESITLPFIGKTGKTDQTSESVFGYIFGKYSPSTTSKPEGTTYQGWGYGSYIITGTSGHNYAYSSGYRADYYYIPTTLKTVIITNATIIPYGAFQNCDFIENITVPSTVTKISNFAFKNCKGITNIHLGTSLAGIGTYAFADCSSLKTITIPNTVENIGSYAFNNCNLLSRMNSSTDGNIVLPTEITTVPSYAFAGCVSILSVQLPKNLATIQNNAFENCVGITELTLLNGLESIGDSALRNVSIKTIIVPDSVTSIGLGAFYGCPLESITLPFVGANRDLKTSVDSSYYTEKQLLGYIFGTTLESTSSNGQNLVYQGQSYNSGYRKYYIPSTLKTVTITDATGLSANAFYGCTMIESLTLNEGITIIYDRAFYNCTALKSMEIPESVASLGVYAFSGCNGLNSVVLPNLTVINDYTFYNCKSLAEITLPKTLTKIGGYAFRGCSALTEIVIPDSVTLLGNYSFAQCNNLINISLSNALTSIENYVFAECANLSKIVLPSTLTNIGSGAFSSCSELRVMEIPESVVAIGDSAFTSCSNLRVLLVRNGDISKLTTLGGNKAFDGATGKGLVVVVPMDAYQAYKTASYWSGYSSRIYSDEYIVNNNSLIVDGTLLQYWGDEKSYTVFDSVKIIGSYAFYGSAVEELKYGATLEQIKNDAFANCTKLAKINSTENGVFNLNGSLKKIATRAFYNNANATKIIVNSSVETIEYAAFMGCNNLVSIELPFIGADRNSAYSQSQVFGYIFGYETSNKEGTTMQYTNYYYYIPASLREVVITDETVISKNAFINCSKIESITIKSDLTSIGDYAFYNCDGLNTITIESNIMPTISAYVFNGDSTVVIKVNSVILSDYQSDVNWSKRTLEAIQ